VTKEEIHETELIEQRHQYRDLDADSACCPEGFTCPACPPNESKEGQ
jgi:hypothetical protein